MSDDEFDNIPDDFADVQDVDWGQILAGPSTAHAALTRPANLEETLPRQALGVPPQPNDDSSYFSDDDDMDSGFFAELDRIEETLTHGQPVAPSSGAPARPAQNTSTVPASVYDRGRVAPAPQPQSHRLSELRGPCQLPNATTVKAPSDQKTKGSWKQDVAHTFSVPSKRPRSGDSVPSISPRSKGKMKADYHLERILSGYEDELTCPICCDLFVASHVGNPCGHTFCGDCGWQWYLNNAANRCCPCCRQTLDATTPMIPNISMNNAVEKHVKALALSGQPEWEPGGHKHRDWMARKQAWQDGAKKREKKKARQTVKPSIFHMGTVELLDAPDTWFHVHDNAEEDPTYEDSDIELIPRPIRRPQRRRQRGGG